MKTTRSRRETITTKIKLYMIPSKSGSHKSVMSNRFHEKERIKRKKENKERWEKYEDILYEGRTVTASKAYHGQS